MPQQTGDPPRGSSTNDTASRTTRYDAIVAEANRLAKRATSYSQAARTGPDSWDCSSSVAQLLRTAGYDAPYFDTDVAATRLRKGEDPTKRITFYIKTRAEHGGDAHMFAFFHKKGGAQSWGTHRSTPGHAVGFHTHTLSGFTPYHVGGLDEPADVPADADTTLSEGGADDEQDNSGSPQGSDTAAAFATFLNLPGLLDSAESLALTGERSLLNDQPLFPFIEQLAKSSLRSFQSAPNGDFFAFYPDYFGGLGWRTPYWEIDDIEIVDGQIQLSDDALATHVFVVGDTANFDGVNQFDRIQTSGVVNVFNAFLADFLNGIPAFAEDGKITEKERKDAEELSKRMPNLADKDKALAFLQRYGARPHYIESPMIRSPYFEAFLAYQTFCLMWSRQFITTFEFTFMPELFPGGIVAFPEYGIQCFIDEVIHEGDYERGFLTRANLSAPAAIRTKDGQRGGDRPAIHAGMIRGFQLREFIGTRTDFSKESGEEAPKRPARTDGPFGPKPER
jgi:hypothetical protein